MCIQVVKGNICIVCKSVLKTKDEFLVHSQQHTHQGASSMQCVVCRQTLASMLELQLHGRHHFQVRAYLDTIGAINTYNTYSR